MTVGHQPLESDEFLEIFAPIVKEILLIRKYYEDVSEFELHKLAATLSCDVINSTFGWKSEPTIEGSKIKPFRLREKLGD